MIPTPANPLGRTCLPHYCQDGLVWRLDALRPRRDGSTGTFSTWQDLSGHGHDVNLSSPITFDGSSVPTFMATGACPVWKPRNDIFVELVLDCTSSSLEWVIFELFGTGRSDMVAIRYTDFSNNARLKRLNTSTTTNPCNGVYSYMLPSYRAVGLNSYALFYSAPIVYMNGSRIEATRELDVYTFPLGGSGQEEIINNRFRLGAEPRLAAMRIYSRELTEAEILRNYRLDKKRFRLA